MKKKYRNKLPKGAEVKGYIAHVDNGEIVVEVELKEKFEPKDGDFLVSASGNVFIYSDKKTQYNNRYCCYCGKHYGNGTILTNFSDCWTEKKGCRFATPEEKAGFLKRLESEAHLRWNAENKCLEDIRWRTEYGGEYFYVGFDYIVRNRIDKRQVSANENYRNNNYFRTFEAAQKVADQIKEIFKNSKAE